MERNSYISCIKINGVPILPPLMTDNIREEMKHYKYLAVTLEEKLRALRKVNLVDTSKCLGNVPTEYQDEPKAKICHSDVDESTVSDSNGDSACTTPNVDTVIHVPKHSTEDVSISNSKDIERLTGDSQESMHLYDDSSSYLESLTMGVERNDYLDVSDITGTQSDSTEVAAEVWKPDVPRTLDIVPITLDSPDNEAKCNIGIMTMENGDPPKLLRQGSYVLDSPSPMLLAHMQTEMKNNEYVPNSSYVPTATTAVKRKEWNIMQAKSEWEMEIGKKESIIADSLKMSKGLKYCGGVKTICSLSGQGISSKMINEQMSSRQSLGVHQPAKSVDCIQAMLAKEYIRKSNDKDGNSRALSKWKTNRNVSILNLSNRFGGSLDSLESGDGQLYNDVKRKCNRREKVQNNCEAKVSRLGEIRQVANDKLQLQIASERLLNVFREIEEMHKSQMNDLVMRQQKEQSLLQKEFEKQQTLVLMEIKKSFPEISTQQFAKTFGKPREPDDKKSAAIPDTDALESVNNANASSSDHLEAAFDYVREECNKQETKHSESFPCPLDFIDAKKKYELQLESGRCQSTRTNVDVRKPIVNGWTENVIAYRSNSVHSCTHDNDQLIDSKENKHSNVSRQLFPLDTNTIHLPVFDRYPAYTEKHVKAATMINAYAKGYLVRRMMQTDRVISLKNTYKEAIVCTLRLHADAPLNLPELNFLRRLELQCDAASMNIVELFAQSPTKRMQVIAHDREIKRSRTTERPTSSRSYSFATQRTLARKKLKEMGSFQIPGLVTRPCSARSRCQTWTSDIREISNSPNLSHQSIKRSTSAGTMRKPWR